MSEEGWKRGRGGAGGAEPDLLPNGEPKPLKRGRGRPRGSASSRKAPGVLRRAPQELEAERSAGAPPRKRGRPPKTPKRRGRPRKTPLPPEGAEAARGPRVWKPLGRPRIYPRAEPASPAPGAPRGRGRPRKPTRAAGIAARGEAPAAGAEEHGAGGRSRARPRGPASSTPPPAGRRSHTPEPQAGQAGGRGSTVPPGKRTRRGRAQKTSLRGAP